MHIIILAHLTLSTLTFCTDQNNNNSKTSLFSHQTIQIVDETSQEASFPSTFLQQCEHLREFIDINAYNFNQTPLHVPTTIDTLQKLLTFHNNPASNISSDIDELFWAANKLNHIPSLNRLQKISVQLFFNEPTAENYRKLEHFLSSQKLNKLRPIMDDYELLKKSGKLQSFDKKDFQHFIKKEYISRRSNISEDELLVASPAIITIADGAIAETEVTFRYSSDQHTKYKTLINNDTAQALIKQCVLLPISRIGGVKYGLNNDWKGFTYHYYSEYQYPPVLFKKSAFDNKNTDLNLLTPNDPFKERDIIFENGNVYRNNHYHSIIICDDASVLEIKKEDITALATLQNIDWNQGSQIFSTPGFIYFFDKYNSSIRKVSYPKPSTFGCDYLSCANEKIVGIDNGKLFMVDLATSTFQVDRFKFPTKIFTAVFATPNILVFNTSYGLYYGYHLQKKKLTSMPNLSIPYLIHACSQKRNEYAQTLVFLQGIEESKYNNNSLYYTSLAMPLKELENQFN